MAPFHFKSSILKIHWITAACKRLETLGNIQQEDTLAFTFRFLEFILKTFNFENLVNIKLFWKWFQEAHDNARGAKKQASEESEFAV